MCLYLGTMDQRQEWYVMSWYLFSVDTSWLSDDWLWTSLQQCLCWLIIWLCWGTQITWKDNVAHIGGPPQVYILFFIVYKVHRSCEVSKTSLVGRCHEILCCWPQLLYHFLFCLSEPCNSCDSALAKFQESLPGHVGSNRYEFFLSEFRAWCMDGNIRRATKACWNYVKYAFYKCKTCLSIGILIKCF